MTDLEICNLALSLHNKVITQEELDLKETKEAIGCALYLPIAKRQTISEFNWSFFTSLLDIDYTDSVSGYDYAYGFSLPQGVLTVVSLEPKEAGFRVLNGRIYTNESEPKVWGITVDCMYDMEHPEDFDVLVGFSLAFLLCGSLAPKDRDLPQTCLQQYAWTKGALLKKETTGFYRDGGTQEREPETATLPKPKYVLTDEGQWILE